MKSIEEHIIELKKKRIEFVVCTIVQTKGSVPRKIGAKMIVNSDKSVIGTIGGGELEKAVIDDAMKFLNTGLPKVIHYDLLHQLNMCCGGNVDVFFEPMMRQSRLYIFGAGHVGNSLAKFASDLDFEIFVIDDRKEFLDKIPSTGISKMNLRYDIALAALPFDEDVFVCIMTYSHPIDRDILSYCIRKPHAYLGMIGSKRKVEVTKKMFRESGIASDEKLSAVDMPMGFDIGAEGPAEIAVSILAKLVEVKNIRKSVAMQKQSRNSITDVI